MNLICCPMSREALLGERSHRVESTSAPNTNRGACSSRRAMHRISANLAQGNSRLTRPKRVALDSDEVTTKPLKKGAHVDEDQVREVPEDLVAEIFETVSFYASAGGGGLAARPVRPACYSGNSAASMNWRRPRRMAHIEPELHSSAKRCASATDLAGWRRERLPSVPRDAYLTLAPDWICEVLKVAIDRCSIAAKRIAHLRARKVNSRLVARSIQTLRTVVGDLRPNESRGKPRAKPSRNGNTATICGVTSRARSLSMAACAPGAARPRLEPDAMHATELHDLTLAGNRSDPIHWGSKAPLLVK